MFRAAWRSGLCVLFACAVAGCASGNAAGAKDVAEATPAGDMQASTPVPAETVYRPPPWKKTYRDGRHVIRREASLVDGNPNKWKIQEFDAADDTLKGALVRETILERGPDGSVFLDELNLVLEQKVLTFDPALVLMPAELTVSKPCYSESDATMREGESESALKTHGQATQMTKLVSREGDQSVIESTLEAKFDFTTIDRSVRLGVVDGRGIVKEVQERTVKFGLFSLSRKTSTVVLVEEPEKKQVP